MTCRPEDFQDGPLNLVLHGMSRNAGLAIFGPETVPDAP